MLVVPENFVGGAGVEDRETGTVIRDLFEFVGQTAAGSLATHAGQTILQGFDAGLRFGFTGLPCQLSGEFFGF